MSKEAFIKALRALIIERHAWASDADKLARFMSADLIPACEAAWEKIGDDYTDAWDWEFLPFVVRLWIEANFDASAVTVEKIVAAATEEG